MSNILSYYISSSSHEAMTNSTPMHPNSTFHPMITRSKAGVVKPNPRYALGSTKVVIKEPTSVQEALKDDRWIEAMRAEIIALEKNQTWSLVPKTEDMNVIGVK